LYHLEYEQSFIHCLHFLQAQQATWDGVSAPALWLVQTNPRKACDPRSTNRRHHQRPSRHLEKGHVGWLQVSCLFLLQSRVGVGDGSQPLQLEGYWSGAAEGPVSTSRKCQQQQRWKRSSVMSFTAA
ncbi:mCG145517, partial [Mus musculus]